MNAAEFLDPSLIREIDQDGFFTRIEK